MTDPNRVENISDLERQISSLTQKTNKTNAEEEELDLNCYVKKPKSWLLALDWVMIVGMVGLGAFIMVDGIISVI